MVTYISLLVGMIGAILGVLLKPRTKVGDQEVFSRWVWLFLALPVAAFGISAAKTYKDGVDADAAKAEASRKAKDDADAAERRRVAEGKLAESRRSQELALSENRRKQELNLAETRRVQEAQAAAARLEILRSKVDQSINRVSYFQSNFSWAFTGSELRLPERTKEFMKSYLAIYTEIRHVGGKNTYGFSSAMYDNWRSAADDEKQFAADVEKSVNTVATAAGGVIFIGKPGTNLFERIPSMLSARFGFPSIDLRRLPSTIVWYPMENPRSATPTPPLPTVSSQWDWSIPDKDVANPQIVVGWINRILNDRNSNFIASEDFKGAEVVLYAPRPNPDFDSAPALGAYGDPIGMPLAASVNLGGRKWRWSTGRESDQIALRAGSEGHKQIVGYMLRLKPE